MPELTKAQLDARAHGMGSTDIVEWCGLSPWEGASAWRVYNAKIGLGPPSPNVAGSPDGLRLCGYPTPSTEEQAWGHVQERAIAEWYMRNVSEFMSPEVTTPHPDHTCIFATLDGYTHDRTIEIKNVSGFMARDWDASDPDGVPHYVRAQVQIGMACIGRSQCDVVAGVAGRPPHVWSIAFDKDLAERLIRAGLAAWRAITLRHPPPLDGSDACREYLRVTYPKDERKMLETMDPVVSARLERLGADRGKLSTLAKQHAASVQEIDTEILSIIGEHAGYEGDGWKMTWKVGKDRKRRSRFTWKGGEGDE